MGDHEHANAAAVDGERLSLHDTIPAGQTHPPMHPGHMTCIDHRVLAEYVPEPHRDPPHYGSFLEWAYNRPCEELRAVHPNRCKLFPLLQKHFTVCLGRHCPGYGREKSSGFGRGGSLGNPPNLDPLSIGKPKTNKRI